MEQWKDIEGYEGLYQVSNFRIGVVGIIILVIAALLIFAEITKNVNTPWLTIPFVSLFILSFLCCLFGQP